MIDDVTKKQNIEKARKFYRENEERKVQLRLQNEKDRESRSPQEQLKVLDKRLGNNKGAKKERAKLHSLINGEKNYGKRTKK